MNYNSTRNAALQVTAAQAIAQGISEEGGLFVPQSFPKADLNDMLGLDYIGRAEYVLSRFLTDFTPEEIKACAESAYGGGKFDDNTPAPVVSLDEHGENKHILELWHGPTCAFKDMALQILTHLLTRSLKKTADGKTAVKICHVVEIEVEPVLRRRHGAKEPLDHVIHSKPRPDGNRILSVKQFQFALCGDQRASGIRRNAISFAADKYIGQNAELKPDGGGGAAPGLHADIKAVVHRRDGGFHLH